MRKLRKYRRNALEDAGLTVAGDLVLLFDYKNRHVDISRHAKVIKYIHWEYENYLEILGSPTWIINEGIILLSTQYSKSLSTELFTLIMYINRLLKFDTYLEWEKLRQFKLDVYQLQPSSPSYKKITI